MIHLNRNVHLPGPTLAFVTLVPFVALSCGVGDAPGTLARVSQAATAPSLGTADGFSVLAGATVTNTGETTVARDLGVSPGLAVTGFPPGVVNGTIHAGDAVALQAQVDLTTAYDDAAGQPCTIDLTGQDLGGLTLTPGVYCFSSSAQLTGALVLDAEGDAAAVFIFKIGSTLSTASAASVSVINGGQDCRVFWQVGSSATLGTTTAFAGNILALASITLTTGATLAGRALARTAAVTMDSNQVLDATCGATSTSAGSGGSATATAAGTGGGGTTTTTGVGAGGSGTSTAAGTGGGASTTGAGAAGGATTGAGGSDQGTGGSGGGTTCGDVCVDLETDSENCGACGHVCAATEACIAGSCVPCPP